MSTENCQPVDRSESSPPSDELPAIEDAYAAEESADQDVGEDDLELLDPTSRALETDASQAGDAAESGSGGAVSAAAAEKDDTSDTEAVDTEPQTKDATSEHKLPDWENEKSAHKIIVELKRVESEVRLLLEGRDGRRKRKLAGTRRWLELEEDLIAWRHTRRIDELTIRSLNELITRRHYLFQRLRFVASTRPTSNT